MSREKKNLMSVTENTLKEVSGKLDAIIDNQAKLISLIEKQITVSLPQQEGIVVPIPQVVKAKVEVEK